MANPEKQPKAQNSYIVGIDGLRAFAILMVVAYHLKLTFAKGGLLGVTVFFVISGFLITRSLTQEVDRTGAIHLGTFWKKRILRIWPAILAMVIPLILVSAICNRVVFTKACSDLPSAVFFYNNWWQIFNNVSYFQNTGVPSPLTHTWSLAIEAQFYLIFPVILLLFSRFKKRKNWYIGITVVLAVISMGLMWFLYDPLGDPSRVYYGTDTRIFSFLFGALLAMIAKEGASRKRSTIFVRDGIGAASLIAIFYMMVNVEGYSSFMYRGGQILVTILSCLVIWALLNRRSMLGRFLGISPLKWLGERSYGIYLWHYPIMILISGGKVSSWWICLIEVVLAILFAAFSYRFIETPIRQGAIGNFFTALRTQARSGKEQRRRGRILRRGLLAGILTGVLFVSSIVCIACVPREYALDNTEELEAQAEKASELTEQKIQEMQENNSTGSVDVLETISTEEADSNTEINQEILSGVNLLLIGDSIALGAIDDFYATFPNSICDTAVSRHTTECVGIYSTYVNEHGWNGNGVIYALGANTLINDSLEELRELMGESMPLFVITIHAPYAEWVPPNNEYIHEFVSETPNTYIIDWAAKSEDHDEYFVSDETHLSNEGIDAYINCIKDVVLTVFRNQS